MVSFRPSISQEVPMGAAGRTSRCVCVCVRERERERERPVHREDVVGGNYFCNRKLYLFRSFLCIHI